MEGEVVEGGLEGEVAEGGLEGEVAEGGLEGEVAESPAVGFRPYPVLVVLVPLSLE